MTYAEFIVEASSATGMSQAGLKTALGQLAEVIGRCVARDGSVTIPSLGTFKKTARAERKCRNMWTGEDMTVPAHDAITFTPAKSFKDFVK